KLTFEFKKFLLKFFGLSWCEGKSHWWFEVSHLRKIAHSIEYCVLGIFSACVLQKRSRLLPIMVCTIISLSDQFLKLLLPTREFDAVDLVFDCFGYMLGILAVYLITLLISHIKHKKYVPKHFLT
ncbi:MAG: VanZ family protein, partial [Ruminococcus sp.]|nr:VanZ family protein [Ruminococcus sp.]